MPRAALVVAGAWMFASLGCLTWLLVGERRVARLRRACRSGRLAGEPVLVSRSTGPAVLGVLTQVIVVPEWVEGLGAEAQQLILEHEREHVRARDPLALRAAMLLVALLPWNVALWVAVARLRAAVEIDCDARVLRGRAPIAGRYCRLLLEVGERSFAAAAPLLALAEPATLLERRIDAMMTRRRVRDWRTLLPAGGAVLLVACASQAPRPTLAAGPALAGIAQELATVMAPASSERTASALMTIPPATMPTGQAPSALPRWSAPTAGVSFIPAVLATLRDTTLRNEEAMRRSAMDHRARVVAISDSVIRNVYPELMGRRPGAPAFLALVLDDRDRLMRHQVSYETNLPSDLAAIMLRLRIDTISARTLGLGITANNRWGVTVGHAVEALGRVHGESEMRASIASPVPQSLRQVPYQRIVDSVTRARSPEAFAPHPGAYVIAMVLEEDGRVSGYAEEPQVDSATAMHRTTKDVVQRMVGATASARDITGSQARVGPSMLALVHFVIRK